MHPEFSDAAKEYIYKKEGVILSYYVAGCIMNPNKRTGRSDCLRYNTMIRNLNPKSGTASAGSSGFISDEPIWNFISDV